MLIGSGLQKLFILISISKSLIRILSHNSRQFPDILNYSISWYLNHTEVVTAKTLKHRTEVKKR